MGGMIVWVQGYPLGHSVAEIGWGVYCWRVGGDPPTVACQHLYNKTHTHELIAITLRLHARVNNNNNNYR